MRPDAGRSNPTFGTAPFAGPAGPTPADAALALGWAIAIAGMSLFSRLSGATGDGLSAGAMLAGIVVVGALPLCVAWLRALRGGVPLRDVLRLPRGVRALAASLFFGAGIGAAVLLPAMLLVVASRSVCGRFGMPDPPQPSLLLFFDPETGASARALAGFVAVVVAPACEETLYRAVAFQGLARAFRPAPALIASAAVFSAAHLSIPLFVPLFAVGLAFGAAYRLLGLAGSVAAHAAFNAGNLLLGFWLME